MSDQKREINTGKLLLVDGNSYLYRCYYAIKSLSTSKGIPTNAVFGFARLLIKILKELKPDYVAFAFDTKEPTFRHQEFKEYKIKREPPPEDLIQQQPVVKDMLEHFNMPVFEIKGFEADDIIAYLAKNGEHENLEVLILTGDKDMLQLVNKNIKVMSIHKENYIYDEKKIIERYGITANQVTDFLALTGDSSDNIPGVSGIGEKTALALIKEFRNLDSIYENINRIKNEKLKSRLLESKEIACLSKKLTTLVKPPLDINIADLRLKEPDTKAVLDLFLKLEFFSLTKELKKLKKETFKDELFTEEEFARCERTEVNSSRQFEDFLNELKNVKEINLSIIQEEILISLNQQSYYAFKFENLKKYNIKDILEDEKMQKTGYDFKKIILQLLNNKIRLAGINFDVLLAAYLLNPDKGNYEIKNIAKSYLLKNMNEAEHVCFLKELKDILQEKLNKDNLTMLYNKVEMPLIQVLSSMEITGVKINIDSLKNLSKSLEMKLKELINKIYEIAGEEFNINSPQQLSRILFEKLKLPVVKKTKTGASTDVEVLEELSGKSPLPVILLEYRQLTKLKNTYIDALPELVNKETNKIHTSYNQTGTATGRLSSLNPNLQNIPVRSEIGKEIRKAFVPSSKGLKILSADYSQIELRILAHFSEDKNLTEAFNNNEDIHTRTAMEIFNMEKETITADERRVAKVVNFGIIYGMTPFGLAKELKIGRQEAKNYIDNYFFKYQGVKLYMIGAVEKARKLGYADTILNRRRYIPDIVSKNKVVREFAERVAINMPIQGSASDIIKLAMINIYNIIEKEKLTSKMLLQVHDELVFECPEKEIDSFKKALREVMENVIKLKVPLKVDLKEGDNWGEV